MFHIEAALSGHLALMRSSRLLVQTKQGSARISRIRWPITAAAFASGPPSLSNGLGMEGRKEINRRRNLGVVAHIDAGKTTITEQMLYLSGQARHQGSVDDGTTVTDFLPQERERGITIQAAAVSFPWRGHSMTVIDTPGHVDFGMEVERSVRVIDGVLVVLDGVAGVQAQTEAVWRAASKNGVPAIAFVNKMDRSGAEFNVTVDSIRHRMGVVPIPICLPLFNTCSSTTTKYKGSHLVGIIDLISLEPLLYPSDETEHRGGGDISRVLQRTGWKAAEEVDPGIYERSVLARRQSLLSLVETDEQFMEEYLEQGEEDGEYSAEQVLGALRRSCRDQQSVPVLCGSAIQGIGVESVMDALVTFLPGPLDCKRPQGMLEKFTEAQARTRKQLLDWIGLELAFVAIINHALSCTDLIRCCLLQARYTKRARLGKRKKNPSGIDQHQVRYEPSSDAESYVLDLEEDPFSALAFKVTHERGRGPLVYIRVYSGQMVAKKLLLNTSCGLKERPLQLLSVQADDFKMIHSAGPGEVVVAVGLTHTTTGDTLVHAGSPLSGLHLGGITIPPPVFRLAIETDSMSHEKPLEDALEALKREDPSLHVEIDHESGQTLLLGIGELHLQIIVDRLINEFRVPIKTGLPCINYKEAMRSNSDTPIVIGEDFERGAGGGGAPRMFAGLDLTLYGELDLSSEELKPEKCYVELAPDALDVLTPGEVDYLTTGLYDALNRGAVGGYPLCGVRVMVNAVRCDADTTAGALMFAAVQLVRKALAEDKGYLLEPMMRIEVTTPEEGVGKILNDLTGHRRASICSVQIQTSSSSGKDVLQRRIIHADVPLAELVGYATSLRSISSGEASLSVALHGYRVAYDQQPS